MTTAHIALLRAVNLGAHGKVAMPDLRDAVAKLGFANVRTLLNSGNVVFQTDARGDAALERRLEQQAAAALTLKTDFYIRSIDEWEAIIAANPFKNEAKSDPSHLVLHTTKAAPTTSGLKALRAAIVGREKVEAGDKHLYIVYPDGIGRSKLTVRLIDSKMGEPGTGRNWNTVLKLRDTARA